MMQYNMENIPSTDFPFFLFSWKAETQTLRFKQLASEAGAFEIWKRKKHKNDEEKGWEASSGVLYSRIERFCLFKIMVWMRRI